MWSGRPHTSQSKFVGVLSVEVTYAYLSKVFFLIHFYNSVGCALHRQEALCVSPGDPLSGDPLREANTT